MHGTSNNENCYTIMSASILSTEQQLENHKKAILSILGRDGRMLNAVLEDCPEYASQEDVILACVRNNPRAIELASEDLKHNKEFLFKACQVNHNVFQYMEDDSRKNKTLITRLLNLSIPIYGHLDKEEQGDFDIAKMALLNGICSDDVVKTSLFKNKEILLLIAKHESSWLLKISDNEDIVNDKEIMSIVIQNNLSSFWWLSDNLKKDVAYLVEQIHINPGLIKGIDLANLNDCSPLITAYMQASPDYPREFIRDNMNFSFLPILVSQALKTKPQSYFLEALKTEDSYQNKLNQSGVTPLSDFCVDQIIENLDLSSLDYPAKSSFIQDRLRTEKNRKSLLSIQGKASKANTQKKRKMTSASFG